MKQVVVIYNPFSGRRKIKDLPERLRKFVDDSKFELKIWPTEKAADVLLLTDKAIMLKADYVLAAGGDGTINQMASRLVNTNIPLGIIPLGSGNGFARHFKISMHPEEAIRHLSDYTIRNIDTVWFNRHCMVNVGGIGFDAQISAAFAGNAKRGFLGYLKTIINHLNYKCQHYQIFQRDRQVWEGDAFMISIANATQWGNNVRLYPGAEPDDGIFNLVIIKKFSIFKLPLLLKNLLEGKLHKNKNSVVLNGSEFKIIRDSEGPVHVDGEPLWLGKEININIEPLSLKILSNG